MKKAFAILMILLLLSAAGCRKADTEAPTPEVTAEPAPATEAPAPGAGNDDACAFTFTARTLEGETVTEAFFGQYDLVMVNVWASWCGPCKAELPELGQLCQKLPENVGFLSVTVDDEADLDEAKSLLQENGCTFPCLDGHGSEGLMNGFLNQVVAIPATIFFDRNGNQVGQWMVGVPQTSGAVSDAYMSEIQARLDLLKVK